ncbi:PAS domain S-box-containing protein [Mucilaginibacter pineti]|uniref:PAS domain S-box-containing protein n=1 Tax=Mucilaginibacter pineti TaxID=1391627 RepID=A0A1G7NVM8_9SPHI|nr:GAF domain-containing protein [Mucilaginibacter pineti]SDF77993.1 PAS domain S-box-containing protein [Mucilaginibacter pineti]
MPLRELAYLQAVNRFLSRYIDKEKELQEIVDLAALVCHTSTAIICMKDAHRYLFKFKKGIEAESISEKESFCQFLSDRDEEVLTIPDALQDVRCTAMTSPPNPPHFRFYAGVALITHDGHRVGSLCVLDHTPQGIDSTQQQLLKMLAKRIIQVLEFDFSLGLLKKQFDLVKDADMKLRSYFESTGAYHLLLGKELEVIAFNKVIADFVAANFGIRLYEGIRAADLPTDMKRDGFVADCQQALAGNSIDYERQANYNGKHIWWHITVDPGYDTDGNIISVSFNATDITERKLHEQHILAQNESLKSIAYIQSHELRRPVASILGLANIMGAHDYMFNKEDVEMLGRAASELDAKIRTIVGYSDEKG